MQRVSSAYRRELDCAFAGASLIKITFGLVDADAASTSTVTSTAGLPWSTPQTMVYEEGSPQRVYATFEPRRMLADGRQLIPPHDATKLQCEGFVSQTLSGADGSFASVPTITIHFTKTHTVPALSFTFDAPTGDYPSSLRVKAWRGNAVISDRTVNPASAEWTLEGELERFNKLELFFLATAKPHRRARIQQLMFGVGMMFDNRLVQSASQRMEIDPIMRRLPQNTFDFVLINTNLITGETANMYDPDNPKGVWKYMEQRSPIKVEYGQTITQGVSWADMNSQTWADTELTTWQRLYEGGFVEWLQGGRYYLNATPSVDGLFANFKATDAFGLLDGQYSKGVYDGVSRSLYNIAADVLADAGLPQLYADTPPWVLWEGLREIYTTAPPPVMAHRELLQLIAHAGCCVLYTDRDGIVLIAPAPTERYDLSLDFAVMLSTPKATKIPTLSRVDCPAYSYAVDDKVKQLHSGSHYLSGRTVVSISFAAAVVDSVTVEGGELIAYTAYAHRIEVVATGNGTAQIVVTGRDIISSSTTISATVSKADENGVVEVLDNPLITAVSTAAAVANWVRDYLEYRTAYEFDSRGNPECDPLDVIELESSFDKGFPATVLKNEITFDGGIRGKMICKRRVKGET